MRVVSILVVVLGHWIMAAVTIENGEIVPGHLLTLAEWTHPFTWIFQVMPIFFFVGGYANALSLRSARKRGEVYGEWLRKRLRRLLLPVMPLVVVWGVGGWIGVLFGVDLDLLRLGSQNAMVATWFLAAYIVVVTLAPVALAVWERLGWWSVLIGIGISAVVDLVSISQDMTWVGFANYVFVWVTVHQLGFAWVDGRVEGVAARAGLSVAGLLATLMLVWLGPYPVAMVGLTDDITNSFPPRLTLLCLGIFQAGLVLVLTPYLNRWAQRRRPWEFVVGVSAQIMTLYLWHLTAMIIVIILGAILGGFGFGITPLTAAWWWTRPAWFAVLLVVTLGLLAVFGRFERPVEDTRPAPPWWRPVIAVAMACAGLGLLAATGIADEDGLNLLALSLPIAGVILGGVTRSPGEWRSGG